jgi:predicted RNA-binding protein with TRAM domain
MSQNTRSRAPAPDSATRAAFLLMAILAGWSLARAEGPAWGEARSFEPVAKVEVPWRLVLRDAAAELRRSDNEKPCLIYLFSGGSLSERELASVWRSAEALSLAHRVIWLKADIAQPEVRSFAQRRGLARFPVVLLLDIRGREVGRLDAQDINPASLRRLLLSYRPPEPEAAPPLWAAPLAGGDSQRPDGDAFSRPAWEMGPPRRPVIEGWTQIQRVDAEGGRGVFRGRPILARGLGEESLGRWVYFHSLEEVEGGFAAQPAPAPIILREPPRDKDGYNFYEEGQWYDAIIVEPAIKRPGEGVARLGGMVTFVPGAAVGDRVIIELERVAERWVAARLVYKFPRQPAEEAEADPAEK